MIKKTFLVSLIALFLVVGTVNAQTEDLPNTGMLPGNPFYFLETLSEGIGTFFTFGDVKKAERYLALASERLAEADTLAEKGKSNRAEKATEKYQERIDKALAKAEKAKTKGKDTDAILEKIAEATVRHQAVLATVYERVPEQAKEAIQRAMEKSARGHETALSAVSGEKQEEVRGRVKLETEDVDDVLEGLRGQGLPIPKMNKEKGERGQGDDIEENEVEEVETEDEDDGAGKPEDAGNPDNAGRP